MGRLTNSMAVKVAAMVAALLVVLGGVGIVYWSSSAAGSAAVAYQAKRRALDTSLQAAGQQGYTSTDLAPITARANSLDAGAAPWWLPGRPGYFDGLTAQTGALQGQLTALEQRLLDQARANAARQSDAAKTSITQGQQANAPDPDGQSLQQRLDAVS